MLAASSTPTIQSQLSNGKGEGQPQRFTLEFFIHFKEDDDRGKRAKFQVTFARLNKPRRHTVRVWATVPPDANVMTVANLSA
jgi:hypothetical protein